MKGTTGTQASFLELFDGDHAKRPPSSTERVVAAMGFDRALPVTGQTYTRKIDAQILAVVAGVAASAAKFACDVRLLQSFGEIEEPFESEQVGLLGDGVQAESHALGAHRALARFVITMEENANQTHSVQFFERTLDDSANRRLVLPESFLATDAILVLMGNIAAGLEVHPARIRSGSRTSSRSWRRRSCSSERYAPGGSADSARDHPEAQPGSGTGDEGWRAA